MAESVAHAQFHAQRFAVQRGVVDQTLNARRIVRGQQFEQPAPTQSLGTVAENVLNRR